jgi:hypothetical protein
MPINPEHTTQIRSPPVRSGTAIRHWQFLCCGRGDPFAASDSEEVTVRVSLRAAAGDSATFHHAASLGWDEDVARKEVSQRSAGMLNQEG